MVFPFSGAMQKIHNRIWKEPDGHHTLTPSLHKDVYTEKQTSYYISSGQ